MNGSSSRARKTANTHESWSYLPKDTMKSRIEICASRKRSSEDGFNQACASVGCSSSSYRNATAACRRWQCRAEIPKEFRSNPSWVNAVSVPESRDVSVLNRTIPEERTGSQFSCSPGTKPSGVPISRAKQLCNSFTNFEQAQNMPIDLEKFYGATSE